MVFMLVAAGVVGMFINATQHYKCYSYTAVV